MNKVLSCIALSVLIILSIGFVSAESLANKTVVNGVVYNADYSEVLKDVQVTVTCNGNTPFAETTKDDGSYAVVFPDFESCGPGSFMSGQARLGELVANQPSFEIKCGNTTLCSGVSCNGNSQCTDNSLVVLLNFALGAFTQPPAVVVGGGGGGSGGFAVPARTTNDTNVTTLANPSSEDLIATAPTEETQKTTRGGITGAVIGLFGNVGTGIIFVVIVVLAGAFVTVRVVRYQKAKASK